VRLATTDPTLRRTLELDEGRRTLAYRCSAGIWTVGVGHNLETRAIPEEAVDLIFSADLEAAISEAATLSPVGLCETRQRVLVEMVYQMGISAVRGFRRFLSALEAEDYDEAAREMLDSAWARQTPARAQRAAQRMRSGEDDRR